MIELQNFDEEDFKQLISEISDSRFLLQWAGPKYTYPLDIPQLKETVSQSFGERPLIRVFKVIDSDTKKAIGHIQLLDINYEHSSCTLSRVLIFSKFRGTGFGKEMISSAVEYAFVTLGLMKIVLGVFDFNHGAIATYEKIGFMKYRYDKGGRQFQNEQWNIIRMELYQKRWQNNLNSANSNYSKSQTG